MYNSNSASFISEKDNNSAFSITHQNGVNLSEKTINKGMAKFVLGMVYFVALIYSLFILLT